jgi:hypothetical protein
MAVPVGVSAAQIAQQHAQDKAANPVAKQGQSKFDQAMAKANPAQATQAAQAAQAPQAASEVQRAKQVQQVQQVGQLDKAQLNNVNVNSGSTSSTLTSQAVEPPSRATAAMTNMLSSMEKGGGMLDKLINGGLKGAKFSNTELLSLQAGMYKYTQELDLTGKVVDKATSALKDTLKTQV